ncbi:MAG: TIGR02757 family protein [Polyangiaceae bacterium]|nr:TIGR02757 family protein [Polyangiaceae bacterium]
MKARSGHTSTSLTKREKAVQQALDRVRATCDTEGRKQTDPIEFVHQYERSADKELVALLASAMAFGNVTALRAKIKEVLERIGPNVVEKAEDLQSLRRILKGFRHRLFTGDDVARLLYGARSVQSAHGSLGNALRTFLNQHGELKAALIDWTGEIRRAGGLNQKTTRRGPAHILSNPAKGSAVKRLLLLLRWMIRPNDGVDLGLWPIAPSVLLIPVDTHIHKLSRNLGLTDRRDVSFQTAVEITNKLRRFDNNDPVKYDFSLCHMGMAQRCPSKRDPLRCEGCGVKSVCRHWE